MAKVVIVLAGIVDVAIAALLIGVSGFIFGEGPESMHGGPAMVAGYVAAVIACVAAPVAGFILARRAKPVPGLLIAWTPPIGALLALTIPPPY